MTRKQRRLEAKLNGVKFEPQYNGHSPVSYEEYSGVGNERFNNRFVDFTVVKETKVESVVGDKPPISGTVRDYPEDLVVDVVETTGKTNRLLSGFKKMMGRK